MEFMSRALRLAIAAISCIVVCGCFPTSEIKNLDSMGLNKDIPTGTVQSGYGDGKGDSIGGGGAAPAADITKPAAPAEEHSGGH